jgi:hypothetical protein
MDTDRSSINGNCLNIEHIRLTVDDIVKEYFSYTTKSLLDIISEMRNKYD